MASGDSFLNTLTIEGEYDRLHNFRKFKEPIVYVRLTPEELGLSTADIQPVREGQANLRLRGPSDSPGMGRRRLSLSPVGARDAAGPDAYSGYAPDGAEGTPPLGKRIFRILSFLWLPVCFTGINAVCYAIDPAAAAVMMASSTFLLHQMGVASRHVTVLAILVGCVALLLHDSDVIYIMAVHTLYYCAIAMKSNSDSIVKTKRTYTKATKRSGRRYDD